MWIMRMAGWTWACGVFLAAGAVLAPANAQELSEKATRTFMSYAWQLTPAAFTKPDGTTIQIDKKKMNEVMVPLDVAREVIRAGRLSAHAQVCELAQDQSDNHNSLMKRHVNSKKWTPQQLVYINQLHLTTVMLLTGRIKLVEKQGDKEVVVEEEKREAPTCSDEQRQKVKELITAYVKAGPSLASKAAPAPAQAADAQPAGAAPVKK
jgi:hypothetical protein